MKNENNSERKSRFKKQLVSTGVYIALAAAVVGITSSSVKKILGGTEGYEIPEPQDLTKSTIRLPSLDTPTEETPGETKTFPLPAQTDYEYPGAAVSETQSGVTAEITDVLPELPEAPLSTNMSTSTGEPEDSLGAVLPGDGDGPDSESDLLPPSVRVKPAAGYISREFSQDELLYTPTMNDFRTHDGIDITGDIGSPVSAFADGVITDVYQDALMGTTVVIRHSGGLVSSYSNLSEELPQGIEPGAAVKVGTAIGGIGESAIIESAEVPHVHFSLYQDEICINPEEYLS